MSNHRKALLIASYSYEDKGIGELVAPAMDAQKLKEVLADPEIGDFSVQILLNQDSHKILLEIESFYASAQKEDFLLLYFSCHGLKDKSGELYFATKNSNRKLLRSTAISANFVNDVMRHSKSMCQVLLLDTCYSGAFARGMRVRSDKNVNVSEYFKEGKGHAILTASDAMQYAFEGDDVTGKGSTSIFTSSIIDGLKTGKADINQDGVISFDDLSTYVSRDVSEKTPHQVPRVWVFDLKGDIKIAKSPYRIVKALPEKLNEALTSNFAGVRRGAVDELEIILKGRDDLLKQKAHEELLRLETDDSREVVSSVKKILGSYKIDNIKIPTNEKKDSVHSTESVLVYVPQSVKTSFRNFATPVIPKFLLYMFITFMLFMFVGVLVGYSNFRYYSMHYSMLWSGFFMSFLISIYGIKNIKEIVRVSLAVAISVIIYGVIKRYILLPVFHGDMNIGLGYFVNYGFMVLAALFASRKYLNLKKTDIMLMALVVAVFAGLGDVFRDIVIKSNMRDYPTLGVGFSYMFFWASIFTGVLLYWTNLIKVPKDKIAHIVFALAVSSFVLGVVSRFTIGSLPLDGTGGKLIRLFINFSFTKAFVLALFVFVLCHFGAFKNRIKS